MENLNERDSDTLKEIYADNLRFHSVVAKNLAAIVVLLVVIAVILLFK